jgi:sucrose-6-phosphate hydrolase SacC (GH32 family)
VPYGANGEETLVGYDAKSASSSSIEASPGQSDFDVSFARGTAAAVVKNGSVHLRVLVDWSSVQVFAGARARTVLTDLIFPAPSSDGVALFAEGGSAQLRSSQCGR